MSVASLSKPSPMRALVMAARLPTLMVGACPLLVAAAFVRTSQVTLSPATWGIWAAALLATLLMQVGANLVNDVKDAEKGVDSHHRQGPQRVTQSGVLSAAQVRRYYLMAFAMAVTIGAGLAVYAGPVFFGMAVLCSLVAFLYTGGPLPLAYLALGEVMAFLFFGPVAVAGTYYLVTKTWDPSMLIWGAGPGLLAAAVMGINNVRDRDTDRLAGKVTLATLLGGRVGRLLPVLSLFGAQAVMLRAVILRGGTWPSLLAFLLASVPVFLIVKQHLLRREAGFNLALKKTALFCLIYAGAFFVILGGRS